MSGPRGEPRLKIALAIPDLVADTAKFWSEAELTPPLECSWRNRPISAAEVDSGGSFVENRIWHQRHHLEPVVSGQSTAAMYGNLA